MHLFKLAFLLYYKMCLHFLVPCTNNIRNLRMMAASISKGKQHVFYFIVVIIIVIIIIIESKLQV